MNLIVEIWKNDCSVELNFYYGVTEEKGYEVVNKHKSLFVSGKYKKLDHIVSFSGSEPDRIVVELPPGVQEIRDNEVVE